MRIWWVSASRCNYCWVMWNFLDCSSSVWWTIWEVNLPKGWIRCPRDRCSRWGWWWIGLSFGFGIGVLVIGLFRDRIDGCICSLFLERGFCLVRPLLRRMNMVWVYAMWRGCLILGGWISASEYVYFLIGSGYFMSVRYWFLLCWLGYSLSYRKIGKFMRLAAFRNGLRCMEVVWLKRETLWVYYWIFSSAIGIIPYRMISFFWGFTCWYNLFIRFIHCKVQLFWWLRVRSECSHSK